MTDNRESSPPRVGDWLLRRFLPAGPSGDSVRGDLYEEYKRRSASSRDVWYVWQAVLLAVVYGARTPGPRGWSIFRWNGFFQTAARDTRHALRRWRTRPAFTALTVAALALGIGATTSMFTVVDRVLLRDLPYPAPHELVTVWNTYPTWRGHEVLDAYWDKVELSYPEYIDWRSGKKAFESVAIYATERSTLTGLGNPALIGSGRASSSLFPMLGAQPVLGRTFRFDEEGDNGARVAVISHGFWMRRLGGSTDAVGRLITVDGEQYRVIGVLPASFRLRSLSGFSREEIEVWVPAGIFGEARDRGWHIYEGIARIEAGRTLEQAAADAGPLLRGENSTDSQGIRVRWRADEEVAHSRGPLWLLLLSAGMLMAIAGVNMATLMTAETTQRRHEFRTRRAVGASRAQIVSQLLVESVSIGVLGALLGVAVASYGVQLLVQLAPPELTLPDRIPIAARVFVFSGALGVLVGIVFGVIPATFTTRSVTAPLSARTIAGHSATGTAMRFMVGVEAVLCVVLLVVAALLARSLLSTQSVDPGFGADGLTAVNIPVSGQGTRDRQMIQFAHELINRVGAVPGVSAVTGANAVPFSGQGGSSSFRIEGRPVPPGAKLPEAHRRSVLPGYHSVLGVPVLSGRSLTASDVESSAGVVVVSETLAREYWPGASPIGAFILRDGRRWEIVGIVGDVLHHDLTEERQSTFYFSFFQQPPTRLWLIVRSSLKVEGLVAQLRSSIAAVAPEVALGTVERLETLVQRSTAGARYRMTLVSAFGVCSLLLAAIGMSGLTARTVLSRRRELGIRMALGASARDVTNAVVRRETSAMLVGVVIGLVIALVVARAVSTFLYGISPHDIPSFVTAALGMALVGWAASYFPARRVATVAPAEVLQAE